MGGMVEAIEQGYPQTRDRRGLVPVPAGRRARATKIIVGVNDFVQDDEPPVPILYIDDTHRRASSCSGSTSCARRRDNDAVGRSLDALRAHRARPGNTMEALLDCVRAYATVGEMCDALREVWGEYEEVPLV